MVDSGIRIAAAFLPAGVPVVVGIVLAVLRRRVAPRVSRPAIAGLLLQLVILLVSTFLVGFLGFLPARGWSPEQILTLSSVLGLVVILLQLVSWPLILLALFARLPAEERDRTPTGRHALLDERGVQVVAEEGTTLLPVAAGVTAGIAGGGALAAAASVRAPEQAPPAGPPGPPFPPPPPDDLAMPTETFAVPPDGGPAERPIDDQPALPPETAPEDPAGDDVEPADEPAAESPADEVEADAEDEHEPVDELADDVETDADPDEDAEAPSTTEPAGDAEGPESDDVDETEEVEEDTPDAESDETPDDETPAAAPARTPLAVTSVRPATARPAPASHPGTWAGSAGPTVPDKPASNTEVTEAPDAATSTEPEEHPWFTPTGTGRATPAPATAEVTDDPPT